ncbi:MAG: amino acid ABC transporter ATP-binding/permease protein [Psychrobacter sp.]|uniref:amino acid ABC transporter ATP-binding/permease protein n=1 Tax=Psychrobacter sp. AOP7-B1-24 TaxID=3457645 RepID=UPI003FB86AE4
MSQRISPNPHEHQMTDKHLPAFRLRDMFKPSFDLWLISWLLGLIFAISIIALLMISGWFITSAALAGMLAVGSHAFNYMVPAGIIRMLAMARTASRYGELMVSHHAVFGLLKTLRLNFFSRLAAKPLAEQRQALHSSQYMHRLVSDIDKLDEFILRVISPWLISTITMILLAVFIGFVLPISTLLKLVIFALLTLALLLPLCASYLGIAQAQRLAEASESRRHKLLAPLAIITQLLLWQQWYTQTKDYTAQDNALQKLEWQAQKQRSGYILGIQWLFYLSILAVLFAVATSDTSASFNVPLILAVILGLLGIQEIVVPLGQNYLSLGNSIAAKNRLNALLKQQSDSANMTKDKVSKVDATNEPAEINVPHPSLPLPTDVLTAELKNVYAKIPKALVGAQNVSASIQSGTPLIIRGPSGCGKSTLLQMLAGELPALSGEVTLNGKAWNDYDWKDQLGYLGQQLDIFDQSLAANLRLGKANASDAELIAALDKVGLSSWLQAQPQGLTTPLGEYGAAISGGQARRIALARLLLKPRRVLLLDEPFAGLDTDTRAQVWQNVRAHQKNDLLIIVSHHEWNMGHCKSLILEESVFTSDLAST